MAVPSCRSPGMRRRGFTLTELLVVIGIAVLLMGISVPVARSLTEGNRMMTCKAQLQQIYQALKMYHADEGVLPPFDGGVDDPGLAALYEAGYLTKQMTLHCPRDVYTQTGDAGFYQSFMVKDEDATAADELNKYPYRPFRGISDETDVNYRRQLQGAASVAGLDLPWHPADDTVVTWCKWHVDTVSMSGVGQYQVLFWDGSVLRVGADVMRDAGIGPDETWKVRPADATGG
jgi:prepilin-type N-terminal cleavage/methylation domain-containing protein